MIKKKNNAWFLPVVALVSWIVPGAGYFILKEKKRAIIIFLTISLTFAVGIYVASIAVIDPAHSKPWFVAQILNSPLVAIIGSITVNANLSVYGRTNEVGQIYTSIAGLLNLLCIVNSVHLAYKKTTAALGG